MTPRDNAVAALELRVPEYVPHFELEFQLNQELLGREYIPWEEIGARGITEVVEHNAGLIVDVCRTLEWSIIPVGGPYPEARLAMVKAVRDLVGNDYMVSSHGDFTFSIPSGEKMLDFVYWLNDSPDDAKEHCKTEMERMRQTVDTLVPAGVDCFFLCCDYCFNDGPFLSPQMFADFVAPSLTEECEYMRDAGAYVIKHTDGQIMPIIDQLVSARPHALHSLDPMAGVDIAEVKRDWGDKVALCGNVNCALLQTGTDEEVLDSARYCMEACKPGGGYLFCTSNVPFKGMELRRYMMIHDYWRRERSYS